MIVYHKKFGPVVHVQDVDDRTVRIRHGGGEEENVHRDFISDTPFSERSAYEDGSDPDRRTPPANPEQSQRGDGEPVV